MSTKEICTITFVNDGENVDVIVTSHPNGNDLEKLAKSVLEAVQALVKRHDPPNPQDQRAGHPAPMNPIVGPLSDTEQ